MKKQSREKTLETLLVLSLFFLVIFFFIKQTYILYICAFFLACGIFDNAFSRYLAGIWISFSEIIGKISTFILLSIIFYFLITPIAFIWRIFNPRESGHFLKDNRQSLLEERKSVFDREYFEKSW